MSQNIQNFIYDCRKHSDLNFIVNNLERFPEELAEIARDRNGAQALEAGVALFAYLADLVEKDIEEGMSAWNVMYQGYPGYPHTGLFGPYFDVCRTRLLWFNAIDHLDVPPVAKSEITLNVYLRWYVATMELARKMLVFGAYCRSRVVVQPLTLPRFLFQDRDPGKMLEGWGPASRSEPLLRFYKSEFRHAIAHGNIIMALPQLIEVRLANDERSAFDLKRYVLNGEDTASVTQDLIRDLQAYVEPFYQSIRVFFFIFTAVQSSHYGVLKGYLGSSFSDPLIVTMVKAIQTDPMGMRDWQQPT